jgi:hypothetical protein
MTLNYNSEHLPPRGTPHAPLYGILLNMQWLQKIHSPNIKSSFQGCSSKPTGVQWRPSRSTSSTCSLERVYSTSNYNYCVSKTIHTQEYNVEGQPHRLTHAVSSQLHIKTCTYCNDEHTTIREDNIILMTDIRMRKGNKISNHFLGNHVLCKNSRQNDI